MFHGLTVYFGTSYSKRRPGQRRSGAEAYPKAVAKSLPTSSGCDSAAYPAALSMAPCAEPPRSIIRRLTAFR
jgi:hypothetical protein